MLTKKKQLPEERLFQSIILQAFEDVLSNSNTKLETYFKIDAYEWFTKKPEDFQNICWLAGLDPDVVSDQVNSLKKRKVIKFNDVQRKWNEYRSLYRDYRAVKTAGERKKIMVKILRLKIKS